MNQALVGLLTGSGTPVWSVVAREWARALSAAGAILFLFDGTELRVGGAFPGRAVAEKRLIVPAGQGLVGQVAIIGHAIHMAADSPRSPDLRLLLGLGETGSVARLCLPARSLDGQTMAVVAVHRAEPFSGEDLGRWQPIADLMGLRLAAENLRDAVDAHHGERDRLIAAAISAQEAERRRIAFDLHDGVTTALASMSFHLNAAELSLGQVAAGGEVGQVAAQIAAARSLLDLAYAQTRAAITGLHSLVLDDHGLVAAVETLVETAPGLEIELVADDEEAFADVSNHAAAALFRIAQETISNAVRHAQASRVEVSLLRSEGAVVLATRDDGVGFDPRAAGAETSRGIASAEVDDADSGEDRRFNPGQVDHFGLSSIAERCALIGASLQIDSNPGRGTSVTVELPMPQQ
ncbi:sensor histidine kinase [Granulicoccus sp. GXG6511]|uniref:sensor histidine kinase n=1 Tax=Granulicoccus sp. GXG6511 TaxID=3381351 RepID=UPI003D7DCA1E